MSGLFVRLTRRCSEPHHHRVLSSGRPSRLQTRVLARPRASAAAAGR
jgi:hypothetical protein